MQPQPALPADADGIAAVHVRAWQAAYAGIIAPATLADLSIPSRAARWREALQAPEPAVCVSRHADGRVAGFCSYGPFREAAQAGQPGKGVGDGEIWALYVEPPAWGIGHGQRLLKHALAALARQGFRRVQLWVLAGNERGIRFYGQAGFEMRAGSLQTFELAGQTLSELAMERWLER